MSRIGDPIDIDYHAGEVTVNGQVVELPRLGIVDTREITFSREDEPLKQLRDDRGGSSPGHGPPSTRPYGKKPPAAPVENDMVEIILDEERSDSSLTAGDMLVAV